MTKLINIVGPQHGQVKIDNNGLLQIYDGNEWIYFLLKCPFCGGEATYRDGDWNTDLHYIQCCNDDCQIQPMSKYASNAEEVVGIIKAWNKRR